MSDLGIWHPGRLGRGGRRFAIASLFVALIAVSLACASRSEPVSTPEPTPTAVTASAAEDASPVITPPPSPAELGSLLSLPDLVERVESAVVSFTVQSVTRGLFYDFADLDAGSGIVVSPDGYIVTNFHVIQNADEIMVSLPSGETYEGTVVGLDRLTDLAVVKIDAENLPTVTFGNSDDLKVGDWVVALGNALALKGGPTVTLGIVSGRGRTITTERGQLYDLIQTDAAINDGNSGGPLVNLDGEVVGISTAILRQAQGIGFAVSSTVASPIIDSLIEHGRVVRPLIGLVGAGITPAIASELNLTVTDGIIVTRMSQDGPSYEAGIRVGDVITRIDGIPTSDMARFLTLLWTYDVGDVVQVDYVNGDEARVAAVTLAERPPD